MKGDRVVAVATIVVALTAVTCVNGHLAVMSVDLGSEYIKIAIVKPGVPMEIITNEDSARKTPTIVCLKDGERMFGNPAENCATKYPSNAFWYLTQIVGKKFDDPAVETFKRRFPYYNLVRDEKRGTILFQVDDETQYTPEELLAMILEKARHYAETFADQTIRDAVITVPSYFNQAERRAVLLAAELSGLNVLQLLGDNAAVALNYGVFRRKQFNSSMTYIMFFDMGATSTTATVVGYQVVKMKEGTRVVENPQLVVQGVGFDTELGGLEISIRLRDHLARYFQEHKKTKSDVYTNHRAMAKLLKEAKRVKKVLSANVEHMAQVEGLLDDEDFRMKVTRQELEEMCADMFNRVTKPIDDALKASEITLAEISDVILMGGGTRIPLVQAKLQEYLGRVELGKSINTDEAAALGAVYQAAHLGKGFKVLTFGVKEANVYPIVVEFEKQRTEESSEPARTIKRTLFGRMNPFPQKKVMTFNKHVTDFNFTVNYGDLDFLSPEQAETMRRLHGQIQEVALQGVAEAYAKHTDAKEVKGIKAHFRMDESGILHLDLVEVVFEKEELIVEEESTWSKLGGTLSGIFGSPGEKKEEETSEPSEPAAEANATENQPTGGEGEESKDQEPDKTDTDQSDAGSEGKKEEEVGTEESKKEEETEEKKEEEAEKPKEEEKTADKEDKKEKTDEQKDEGGKKPKIIIVKENITVDLSVTDTKPPSNDSLKASRKKLAELSAKDKEKKLLEKAKNELEAFIYEMLDRLSQDRYVKCSKEEEREKYSQQLSEASDWLYDQEEDTPKEPYIEKLKGLKKAVKQLEFRVRESKERPEALAALESMLNQSAYFLFSLKNLTMMESEDKIFTEVEIETLEKLINDTLDWKVKAVDEQGKVADHEKPKLVVEDIAFKMQALDREMKYLVNKAKNYRPKTKPKTPKNKTEKKTKANDTEEDAVEDIPGDTEDTIPSPDTEEADSSPSQDSSDTEIPPPPTEGPPEDQEQEPSEDTIPSPDTEGADSSPSPDSPDTEIPPPPTEGPPEDQEQEVSVDDTVEGIEDVDSEVPPTEQPVERNTHDAQDL